MGIFQDLPEDHDLDPIVAGMLSRTWDWWMKYTSAERRANAAEQLRDRFGQFAEMGRSSKFSFRDSNGSARSGIGKFIGVSDIPEHGRFLVLDDPHLPKGVYHIKYDNFENVEAVIDLDYLKSQGLVGEDGSTPKTLMGNDIPSINDIRMDKVSKEDLEISKTEVPELPDLKKATKDSKSKSIRIRDLKPGTIVLDGETKRLALVTDVNFDGNDVKVFLRFQDGERRVADAISDRAVIGWEPKGAPPANPNDPTEVQESTPVSFADLKAGDKVFNEGTNDYATVVSTKVNEADGTVEVTLKMADGSEQTVTEPADHEVQVWRTPYLGESGASGDSLKKSAIIPKGSKKIEGGLFGFLKNLKQNIKPIRPMSNPTADPELPPATLLSKEAVARLNKLKHIGAKAKDSLPILEDGTYDITKIDEAVAFSLGPTATAENVIAGRELLIKKAEDDTREFKVLQIGRNFFLRFRSGDVSVDTLNQYVSQVRLLASRVSLGGTPVIFTLMQQGELAPGNKILRKGISDGETSLVSKLLGVTYYDDAANQGIHVTLNATELENRNPRAVKTAFHEMGHVVQHIAAGYRKNPKSALNEEFRRIFKHEIDRYQSSNPGWDRGTAERELFADLFADSFKAFNIDQVMPDRPELLKFAEYYNSFIEKEIADMGSDHLADEITGGGTTFESYAKPKTRDQAAADAEPDIEAYANNYGATNIRPMRRIYQERIVVDSPPDHTEAHPEENPGETDSAKIEELLRQDFQARVVANENKDVPHYLQGVSGTVADFNWPGSSHERRSLGGKVGINARKDPKTGKITYQSHAWGVGNPFEDELPIYTFDNIDDAFKQAAESLADINKKWGNTHYPDFYKQPKIQEQLKALRLRAGESAAKQTEVEAPATPVTTAVRVQIINEDENTSGTSVSTKDGSTYTFHDDGRVTGDSKTNGFLYRPFVDPSGIPMVSALEVHGSDKNPSAYVASDSDGNLSLRTLDEKTGELLDSPLGNIRDMYSDKDAARAIATQMSDTAPKPNAPTEDKPAPVRALGTQNTRAKDIMKLIQLDDKFKVEGKKQTVAVVNFNGVNKPTDGGFGGYIFDTRDIHAGQHVLTAVVVDASGEELTRSNHVYTANSEKTSVNTAKFMLAKMIAAQEAFLDPNRTGALDEMADISSDYRNQDGSLTFPSVQEQSTPEEFNNRKYFYELLLAPNGLPIPVGKNRDAVADAYSKVLSWDQGGQIMFSSEKDKKSLESAIADLKNVYDEIFFSDGDRAASVNLSGLSTDLPESDEMADFGEWNPRINPETTGLPGHKTYDEENIYERLHPGALVRDEITGRIGRVRGLTYNVNQETDQVESTGEFEVEFFEGSVSDLPPGYAAQSDYDATGRKTEVIGKIVPTAVGKDIDERRFYSVEIRDPEDFTSVTKDYISTTPDGPVVVHDSMFGVVGSTKQVGRVSGFLEDGQILVSVKDENGSESQVVANVSDFTPLSLRSSSEMPRGSVRGNTIYLDRGETAYPMQVLDTIQISSRLDNMGFLDRNVAQAINVAATKGYLSRSGHHQMLGLLESHDTLRRNKVKGGSGSRRTAPVASLPKNPVTVTAESILNVIDAESPEDVIAKTVSQVVESADGSVRKPTNKQLVSVERRLNNPANLVSPERAAQIWETLPNLDKNQIGEVIKQLDVAELNYRMDNGLPIDDLYKIDNKIGQLVIRNITPEQAARLVDYKPTKNMDGTPNETSSDEMSDSEAPESAEIALSNEQQSVFNQVESSNNPMFVTGYAGTGKSVLLRKIATEGSKKDNTVVVAPTGIAAINADGSTIASVFPGDFNIPYWSQDPFDLVDKLSDQRKRVLENMDRLIIDEVSMVNSDTMDHMDRILRVAKKDLSTPFGGVQVVMFGDPYQLPPVVKYDDPSNPHTRTFNEDYQSAWFFDANVWTSAGMKFSELTEIFRQKDPEFKELLNALRDGTITPDQLNRLNEIGTRQAMEKLDDDMLRIYATNNAVDSRNIDAANRVPDAEKMTFQANIKGTAFANKNQHPTDEKLVLWEGARIMFIHNAPAKDGERAYANGSYGTIAGMGKDYLMILVDGAKKPIRVDRNIWDKQVYRTNAFKRADGTVGNGVSIVADGKNAFEQFPIKLGYAITTHKSQGQTYDAALIDMGRGAFAPGMAYVAASRVRSPEGFHLGRDLTMKDVMQIDRDVKRFMSAIKESPNSSDEMADSSIPAPKNEPFDPSDPNLDLDAIRGYDYTKRPDREPLSEAQASVMDTMQKRIESGVHADLYKAMRRDLYESWFARPVKSKENSLSAVEARTEVISSKGSDRDLVGNKVTKAVYTDQFGRQYSVVITTRVERRPDGTLVKLPSVRVYDKTAGKGDSDYVGSFGTEISRDNTENGFAPRGSVYISTAETDEPYRRRGIATAMLSLAREVSGTEIRHSRATTAMGNAFANSIGDDEDLVPTSTPSIIDYNADVKDVSNTDEMADEPFDPLDPNLDLDNLYKYDFTKTPDGKPLTESQTKAMEAATAQIDSESDKTWKNSLKAVRRDLYRSWFVSKDSSPENTIDAVTGRLKFNETLPMSHDILRSASNVPVSSYVNYTDQYGREYLITVESIRDAYLNKNRAVASAYDLKNREVSVGSLYSDGDINGADVPVYVHGVNVKETYRRRGLATALLVAARILSNEDIHHSKDTTAFGNAFANSIGDSPDKIKTSKPSIIRDKWVSDDSSDEMSDETPSSKALAEQSVTLPYQRTSGPTKENLLAVQEKFKEASKSWDVHKGLQDATAVVFMGEGSPVQHLPEVSHEYEKLSRAVTSLATNIGFDQGVVDAINKGQKVFNPDHKDLTLDEAYAIASQQMGEFFKDSEVRIRVRPEHLSGILDSGNYETQHEMSWEDYNGARGAGNYAPDFRAGMEHIWFGDPDHHPVYGYFSSPIQPTPDNVGIYGYISLHLTNEAKTRSTATVGDSLVSMGAGVPFVWDKGLDSSSMLDLDIFKKLLKYNLDSNGTDNYLSNYPGYIEAQIHGSVSVEDIAKVTIDLRSERAIRDLSRMGQESYSAMITDLKAKLNAAGIKYDVID